LREISATLEEIRVVAAASPARVTTPTYVADLLTVMKQTRDALRAVQEGQAIRATQVQTLLMASGLDLEATAQVILDIKETTGVTGGLSDVSTTLTDAKALLSGTGTFAEQTSAMRAQVDSLQVAVDQGAACRDEISSFEQAVGASIAETQAAIGSLFDLIDESEITGVVTSLENQIASIDPLASSLPSATSAVHSLLAGSGDMKTQIKGFLVANDFSDLAAADQATSSLRTCTNASTFFGVRATVCPSGFTDVYCSSNERADGKIQYAGNPWITWGPVSTDSNGGVMLTIIGGPGVVPGTYTIAPTEVMMGIANGATFVATNGTDTLVFYNRAGVMIHTVNQLLSLLSNNFHNARFNTRCSSLPSKYGPLVSSMGVASAYEARAIVEDLQACTGSAFSHLHPIFCPAASISAVNPNPIVSGSPADLSFTGSSLDTLGAEPIAVFSGNSGLCNDLTSLALTGVSETGATLSAQTMASVIAAWTQWSGDPRESCQGAAVVKLCSSDARICTPNVPVSFVSLEAVTPNPVQGDATHDLTFVGAGFLSLGSNPIARFPELSGGSCGGTYALDAVSDNKAILRGAVFNDDGTGWQAWGGDPSLSCSGASYIELCSADSSTCLSTAFSTL
jgi:hypothetical protein